MEDCFLELKKKETIRIIEVLDTLSHEQRAIYLDAYSDAIKYCLNFLTARFPASELEANLP